MLQEAIDLQQRAVTELIQAIAHKDEITFRAPTGSGKTRMMADFINRILQTRDDVIFLVSTLSKGNLAEQNYAAFKNCTESNIFPSLAPYLISSEASEEEKLFIPLGYNTYVLPRDMYKSKSRLKDEGVLQNFLEQITSTRTRLGKKKIYLIKDECHQATNNLDALSSNFFSKIINVSATPNLNRGQYPDIEISDDDAENAKLIKKIEWGLEDDSVEDAIKKYESIRENYRNLLKVNPCLIIQISNKEKADEQWKNISKILCKTKYQHLKWMMIVEKKNGKCKTNDKISALPIEKWNEEAKKNASTIDIIIFKMIISEGWDIPRACMLYQIRDSKSAQLDEQVMGRVRRNPRLVDYEQLPLNAQKLATTAWVWGIKPNEDPKTHQIKLYGTEKDIPQTIKIKTTRIKPLTKHKTINISALVNDLAQNDVVPSSIFSLYANIQKQENNLKDLCYSYADTYQKWWLVSEHIDEVNKVYNDYLCNYKKSLELNVDEKGKEILVSFPISSAFIEKAYYTRINDWVWNRVDGSDKFFFDSEAEEEWAVKLKEISVSYAKSYNIGKPNPHQKQKNKRLAEEKKFLWGKNFLKNSAIRYAYYFHGLHYSYPDFILKDKKGKIHLFETKSINISNSLKIDKKSYNEKINALKECYRFSSYLTGYTFYLPIKKGNTWTILRYRDGKEDTLTEETFKKSFV